jgi:hypothetical protein
VDDVGALDVRDRSLQLDWDRAELVEEVGAGVRPTRLNECSSGWLASVTNVMGEGERITSPRENR